MIKGIIFDMDGTLIESMHIWRNLFELYIRSLGYNPEKVIRTYDYSVAAEYMKSQFGTAPTAEEMREGMLGIIEKFYREEAVPREGLAELLEKLSDMGVKMCVASATDRYLIEIALAKCGIRKYFSELFTCGEVGHEKNEPVIFDAALEHLGVGKSECMVVEDALYAVKTCAANGYRVTGIYDVNEHGQDELRSLAEYFINDYKNDADGFLALVES